MGTIKNIARTRTDNGAKDRAPVAFEVKAPNAATRKAIAELEGGKGKKFKNVKALMADLHEVH